MPALNNQRISHMTTELKTKKEAADILRISIRSFDRIRSSGLINTIRIRGSVRVLDSEIERYIAKCCSRKRN